MVPVQLDQPQRGWSAAMAMKAALAKELLPVPRTPHSSAWLLGSPAAKRDRFSLKRSFCRSTPTSKSTGRA